VTIRDESDRLTHKLAEKKNVGRWCVEPASPHRLATHTCWRWGGL